MESNLQSFGIYQNFHGESLDISTVGTESKLDERAAIFWKDRFYVRVIDISPDGLPPSLLLNAAGELADKIQGESKFPDELKIFPGTETLKRDCGYSRTGFMARSFLNNALFCEYNWSDQSCFLFRLKTESDSVAADILENIRKTYPPDTTVNDSTGKRYNGTNFSVLKWGRFIAGAAENCKAKETMDLKESFFQNFTEN